MRKTSPGPAEPATSAAVVAAAGNTRQSYPELQLLLEWLKAGRTPRWRASMGTSVCLHILVFALGTRMTSFVHLESRRERISSVKVTPLYLPPDLLTQRAPNRGQVSKQIDLAGLTTPQKGQRRVVAPAPGDVRRLEIPREKATDRQKPEPPRITAEAPKVNQVDQAPSLPQGTPDAIIAQAPPSPALPQLPAASPGIAEPAPDASRRWAPPKNSVQDVIRSMAHDSNSSHLQISDEGSNQSLPTAPGRQPNPGHLGSAIELKSDPQGADFRPYLAQILAIVKRNWFSVLPESARLGVLRGHTVLQFVVNQDGSIPKLVIASPSGLDPLDRAAVAGLSMSNPLPPLPKDFKGPFIRLQFSFNYNLPSM